MISSKEFIVIDRKKLHVIHNIKKAIKNNSTPGPVDEAWYNIRLTYSFQLDDAYDMIMMAFKNSRNNIW